MPGIYHSNRLRTLAGNKSQYTHHRSGMVNMRKVQLYFVRMLLQYIRRGTVWQMTNTTITKLKVPAHWTILQYVGFYISLWIEHTSPNLNLTNGSMNVIKSLNTWLLSAIIRTYLPSPSGPINLSLLKIPSTISGPDMLPCIPRASQSSVLARTSSCQIQEFCSISNKDCQRHQSQHYN